MQRDFQASFLLKEIHDARVVGIGIEVNRNGPLTKARRIGYRVNRLLRLYAARMGGVHPVAIRFSELAISAIAVAGCHLVILDQELAYGHGHPTVLTPVVVNLAYLAYLPAYGEELV
jgi:hypothetical protein